MRDLFAPEPEAAPESRETADAERPADSNAAGDSLQAKALEVHHRLCEVYHCPLGYFHTLEPLDELISSLLSHRTRNRDSALAFRTLREQFPDWASVRDAPVAEVQEAIAASTWPEQKAPRIQQVLRELTERGDGELTLDFLRDLPVDEARAWLQTLPGVGPKTSAAVISFSTMRGRALPVDSHHHRVAARLGLIPAGLAVGPAHRVLEAQLPAGWDAQQVYDNHQVLMRHGKDVCTWRGPQCQRCVLLDLCPHGQARMRGDDAALDDPGRDMH
ncbi:Fe-S cluster assembly protein HesB [Noviherbaspirillum sp. 17J57-3]|uniref:Fe-S cluster assembly protein HesB n=2 Tax=Noviherbaspirillum galbum TaxID=2709383 RepID=A0A6B3SK70_9BURK|nr:Fe-S cluster assembly protein HesB [Noviherbaspirillum galbum]